MEVILRQAVEKLGHPGDIVKVSAGYARNYLLPRDLAVQPTPNNVKKVEERRKEIERQERERREQQERMIQQLSGVEVHLERRANEQGHLFGSVTATDVAKGLQAQNFNVEPGDVNLPGKLDRIDKYAVAIKFGEDLAGEVKVWVNPDPDSKAAIDAHSKAQAKPDEAAEKE